MIEHFIYFVICERFERYSIQEKDFFERRFEQVALVKVSAVFTIVAVRQLGFVVESHVLYAQIWDFYGLTICASSNDLSAYYLICVFI